MILADKIIDLRKKHGWSQEELAGQLGVSRQAISKWESAQSTPDLERIIAMSALFGVSTDYLIKDELDGDPAVGKREESGLGLRKLSMEEANRFLSAKQKSAKQIAIGVFLCIMAAVPIMVAGMMGEETLGLPIAFVLVGVLVAVAVGLFMLSDFQHKCFEWIEKDAFDMAYGVHGMVQERLQAFMPRFIAQIAIGVMLCIASVALFMLSGALEGPVNLGENGGPIAGIMIVAVAVFLFVNAGVMRGGYSCLLQEEDYSPAKKAHERRMQPIAGIYWLIITASYLGYSFWTMEWHRSWIIWPIAGMVYGVIYLVMEVVWNRRDL